MPSYVVESLVLNRTDLGEHDRVLTLYSRGLGKIAAIAKGARKGKSRLSGGSEIFTQAKLQLATGRSFDIITQCEIENNFTSLRTNLQFLARATYFCELLNRFTGDRDASSSQELFELTVRALGWLQNSQVYVDAVVHAYEIQLLQTLGYSPVLDRCVVCGVALGKSGAGFSASLGGVVCPADRFRASDALPLSNEAALALVLLQTEGAESILALNPSKAAIREIAATLRSFIRYRADRSLKSADFLEQLRASDQHS